MFPSSRKVNTLYDEPSYFIAEDASETSTFDFDYCAEWMVAWLGCDIKRCVEHTWMCVAADPGLQGPDQSDHLMDKEDLIIG